MNALRKIGLFIKYIGAALAGLGAAVAVVLWFCAMFVAGMVLAYVVLGCGIDQIQAPKTTSTTIIPPATREPL